MATALVESYTPLPYDHTAYDTLPSVTDAATALKARSGMEDIKASIRDVFMRHNMSSTYAIQLLHRHFGMAPSERVVEYGPTQSPWPVADRVLGGHIIGKAWRFQNGDLVPYEFKFESAAEDIEKISPKFTRAFVEELRSVLKSTGLSDLLGITTIDRFVDREAVHMEVTFGRNSIVIPAVEVPDVHFQAGWGFREKEVEKAEGIWTLCHVCVEAPAPALKPEEKVLEGKKMVKGEDGIWTLCHVCVEAAAPVLEPENKVADGKKMAKNGDGIWTLCHVCVE